MKPIPWEPPYRYAPPRLIDVPSAWGGNEAVLKPLIEQFCEETDIALEFGVEHGYSTVALSNFFQRVIGVDTFLGDIHTGKHDSYYPATKERLLVYPNIELVEASWQSWTAANESEHADLIHVDIEHTYEQTYGCLAWSVQHAPVVIFHDPLSFADVMKSAEDVSEQFGLQFYCWNWFAGLGILVHS